QAIVPPPANLPDLYEVLWSVAGCGMFVIAWLVTIVKLYSSPQVKYSGGSSRATAATKVKDD
ncbi:MAG: hypothetical protein SGILL_008084, partial [Bacillariaceae sp.]